jgi:hypothetical protein
MISNECNDHHCHRPVWKQSMCKVHWQLWARRNPDKALPGNLTGLAKQEQYTWLGWSLMRHQTLTETTDRYRYIGGRGIKVCDRWLDSFENFFADMGRRPEGHIVQRRQPSRDFTPENAYWGLEAKTHESTRQNTSGFTGIYHRGGRSKWNAFIGIKGHQFHIGAFDTLEEAVVARRTAEKLRDEGRENEIVSQTKPQVAKWGYAGVTYRANKKRWIAAINNGRSNNIHLGYFKTKEEAIEKRKWAEQLKAEGRLHEIQPKKSA